MTPHVHDHGRRVFMDAARPRFASPLGIERELEKRLREVAAFVGQIATDHTDRKGRLADVPGMRETLERYARQIRPWANTVAARSIAQVGTSNLAAWENASIDLGRKLRTTFADTALGAVVKKLHADQVELITSLPPKAAERAQKIARSAQLGAQRASSIQERILALDRTGEVTESRAMLIARTEIAKANASFTQARAQFVGTQSYIWRTMEDAEVRESHAALEGNVFRWDDPPYVDEDEGAHHPGDIWNCRCFAEPLILQAQVDSIREGRYQLASRYDLDF